jgi:hypothetical protein
MLTCPADRLAVATGARAACLTPPAPAPCARHLQVVDGNLVVRDRLNSTVWLAPTNCPAGALLKAWEQCGGTSPPAAAPGASSPYVPRDAQYPGTCCPAGWACLRAGGRAKWSCQPSLALDSCTGQRRIPAGKACGGTATCGSDAMCAAAGGSCCAAGSFCQRSSAQSWLCTALPQRV